MMHGKPRQVSNFGLDRMTDRLLHGKDHKQLPWDQRKQLLGKEMFGNRHPLPRLDKLRPLAEARAGAKADVKKAAPPVDAQEPGKPVLEILEPREEPANIIPFVRTIGEGIIRLVKGLRIW